MTSEEYLLEHNEKEHNYHTDCEGSGFDICMECDLIRRTGGRYEWKEEELVSMETYNKERIIGFYSDSSLECVACVDEGEPATAEALPDGFICANCGVLVYA